MRSPRLQAAMRPPQALLVLVAVALFRPAATQNTCQDPELALRTRQANLVLEASLTRRNSEDVQIRVHGVLKGEPPSGSMMLLRANDCTKLMPDKKKFLLFLPRRPADVLAAPLRLTDANVKAVKKIICKKKRCEPRSKPMKNATVNVREQLELRCRTSGKPQPKFTWYKDGRPLKISRIKRLKSNPPSKLQISHVRYGDAGRYECRAENYWGRAISSAFVTVLDRKGQPRKPKKGRTTVIPPNKQVPTKGTPSPYHGKPCTISDYCMHGGTCTYFEALGELACQCDDGYKGQRCETKDLGNLARQGKGCEDEGMLEGCNSQTLDAEPS